MKLFAVMMVFALAYTGRAQTQAPQAALVSRTALKEGGTAYVLGPDDQITIRALHVEEIGDMPMRIGSDGYLDLPLAGRVQAAGLTVSELERAIRDRLEKYVLDPQVTVAITEYRSEPVSVLGAVKNPGIYQVQGHKSLAEMLSLAGGLDAAAGSEVKITRQLDHGRIPIATAKPDASGKFSVAEVSVTSILKADDPQQNLAVEPNDVITVPRAEMVYVVGQVQKAGGFVLNDRKDMSVLQALSLAGGVAQAASPNHASLLREKNGEPERTETPVDVGKILAGKAPDVAMLPGDILFIPGSASKRIGLRAAEAAIQLGTGIAIWR